MTRLLIVTLLFTLPQPHAHAGEKSKSNKVSQRQQTKTVMTAQIKQLKDGLLLVRLHTKVNSIAALKKMGKNELADEINEKQLNYNKEVVSAFKKNYSFSPVYFFYSNYSDSILSGQINGVVFLNDRLQADTTIKLGSGKFLIAEIGIIEPDTVKHFSHYYYYGGENTLERRSAYYGESDMRFEALKIMSDQLVQLKRPFPYYVNLNNALPVKKRLTKAVVKMNNKLIRYYEKNKEN
jgi:hypothetical protein